MIFRTRMSRFYTVQRLTCAGQETLTPFRLAARRTGMISFRSFRRFAAIGGFVFSTLLLAESIRPSDVEIAGDIEYGQTSAPIEYTAKPMYRALVFVGEGGDRVEVTVQTNGGKAFVAIADGSLKQLASGTDKLVFELPDRGPDAEAFYIVFREAEGKPGKFTVVLKKVG
jgi:hypothetical protein